MLYFALQARTDTNIPRGNTSFSESLPDTLTKSPLLRTESTMITPDFDGCSILSPGINDDALMRPMRCVRSDTFHLRVILRDMDEMELLKEFVRVLVVEEKSKKRRKRRKSGGSRTMFGAKYQVNPSAARTELRAAVKAAQGNVPDAADKLNISPRTLYHYLEVDPSLDGVKTTEDFQDPEERFGKGKKKED